MYYCRMVSNRNVLLLSHDVQNATNMYYCYRMVFNRYQVLQQHGVQQPCKTVTWCLTAVLQ